MTSITCVTCGIMFDVPDPWANNRRNDHRDFWCPNGHSLSFKSESEAEKYKRLYDAEAQKLLPLREHLAAEERACARAQQQVKKLKKRAAMGVCPCCNRTVKQLAAHMKSKHSEFMKLQGVMVRKQLPEKVQ